MWFPLLPWLQLQACSWLAGYSVGGAYKAGTGKGGWVPSQHNCTCLSGRASSQLVVKHQYWYRATTTLKPLAASYLSRLTFLLTHRYTIKSEIIQKYVLKDHHWDVRLAVRDVRLAVRCLRIAHIGVRTSSNVLYINVSLPCWWLSKFPTDISRQTNTTRRSRGVGRSLNPDMLRPRCDS